MGIVQIPSQMIAMRSYAAAIAGQAWEIANDRAPKPETRAINLARVTIARARVEHEQPKPG
jgi:hypothetical protein